MGSVVLADYGALLARLCLSIVFLHSGFTKLVNPGNAIAEVAAMGLPAPRLMLWLTILCQLAGGLMVLLGFSARLGAFALAGFTIAATLLGHRISGLSGARREQELTTALEHLSIVGGFLLVIVFGSGALSLDAVMR